MMAYFVKLKVFAQRSLIYYQLLNSFMIIVLFLRPYELGIWLTVLIMMMCVGLIVTIGYSDTKLKILEREQSHFNTENKELREIISLLKALKDKSK